jgi:CRP/FNR family cyclic AMP-dependent transcriptional regulator
MTGGITTRATPQNGRFHAGMNTIADPGRGLADSAIFSDLEDADLESLLKGAATLRVEAGETVFRRGDPGDSVLFIRSGSVAVQADRAQRGSVPVNVLEAGEIFGEIAVIEGTTRSATVTASEACELLVIPQADFLALLVNHPGLGIRMLGAVAERLRRLTDFVRDGDA